MELWRHRPRLAQLAQLWNDQQGAARRILLHGVQRQLRVRPLRRGIPVTDCRIRAYLHVSDAVQAASERKDGIVGTRPAPVEVGRQSALQRDFARHVGLSSHVRAAAHHGALLLDLQLNQAVGASAQAVAEALAVRELVQSVVRVQSGHEVGPIRPAAHIAPGPELGDGVFFVVEAGWHVQWF